MDDVHNSYGERDFLTRSVSWFLLKTRLVKRQFGGEGFDARVAKAQRNIPPVPGKAMRRDLDVTQSTTDGRTVWRVAPRGTPSAEVLYFHGGGYVYPIAAVHWTFIARMAKLHGIAFTVPFYPLAPASDAEQTTAFALDIYRNMAKTVSPILMGDSAGAGLALAVTQLAKADGLSAPVALCLICPYLDAVPTDADQQEIEARDPLLTLSGVRKCGESYAGDLPVEHPLCSPINGDLSDLPPTLVYGGGDDILVTDARRLKEKVPDIDYREGPGLMHIWPVFFFRESRLAQDEIGVFARKHGSEG
ncbi:MAG: alpha/beta hydrolase fold domain-containing protein [Pacificimonas sp.]